MKGIETLLNNISDILGTEDGRTLEEKVETAMELLQNADTFEAVNDEANHMKAEFWKKGEVIDLSSDVKLRKVQEEDHDEYINVRMEYVPYKNMLKDNGPRELLWEEHMQEETLMFSVVQDNEYVGYCGIHDITKQVWEIAIELKREKTNKGVGTLAATGMLDEIKRRLGVTEYRVRIEPTNYISQRMFEKLGAVPDHISELYIHDPKLIEECEAENLHLIDDNLISVAEKFSVEPRKLLSHVLEYKLIWK